MSSGEPAFFRLQSTNAIPSEWHQPPTNFFRVGPGDVIDIEILGESAAPTTTPVGPDGKIYFSLLPGTFVWGLSLSETKDLLEASMSRYMRVKPELALSLRTVGSSKIWILGSVPRPGVYSLAAPMTLLEAITTAGGAGTAGAEDVADLTRSFVMREGRLLNIDMHRLLRAGDLSQNIYLQPDDLVYLRSSTSREVYVFGAVAAPNILPYSDGMSLVSAIGAVGGPVPYASLSHVAVVRGSLSQPMVALVDFRAISKGKARDVRLEPGDIVHVSFSPTRKLEIIADQILNQFVRTMAINEGRNAVIRGASPVDVTAPFGP